MKVNVVVRDHGEPKILPRLAEVLRSINGWTISERPDDRAHLNYYIIYIDKAERFSDWRKTPQAAYFSHYEPDSNYRKFWWQTALATTGMGIYTANQYGEMLDIPAAKARVPIDPMFDIQRKTKTTTALVGVSGFATTAPRKNINYAARMASDLEGTAQVVASGFGWPVEIVNTSLNGVPAFMNSLSVYVVTSTIEGVPMPPLEALACGIPVVIPRHVGMLDDLPEVKGIYRYDVGDYGGMLEQVRTAIDSRHNRKQLRSYVKHYTPEAWAQDHKLAFEAFMNGKLANNTVVNAETGEKEVQIELTVAETEESDRHGKRGVYYVAYGEPARKCVAGAIQSFRQFMPDDIEIALTSDKTMGLEDTFIEHPDEDIGGRSAKVQIYDLAPADWEYVLYLDADTEIVADVSYLYQILDDGWDMVICKNPSRFHVAVHMKRSDNIEECEHTFQQIGTDHVLQLNGGVFCFQRNERTRLFFNCWYEEWQRYGKRDQAALLRALWTYPVKLFVLGNEWNTITRYDNKDNSAGILHYPMTARRWRGVIKGRIDGAEAWKAVKKFEKEIQKGVSW